MTDGARTVTVLTPTFNRAGTLPRLYESLTRQTFDDFEWLLVDDGSSDETDDVVQRWVGAGRPEVRYHCLSENRGKHVAVNQGVERARGRFTLMMDSDDWLADDGLERLVHHWNQIPRESQPQFSGVVGLCAYEDGRIIGDPYPTDPLDCDPAELTYGYGVMGDKISMLRTDVLREFPFPFEECRGEVIQSIVWNRMALAYVERHVNEVVVYKEYLEGGISDRALELHIQAAPATRQFFLEEARLPRRMRVRRRLRAHANYVRFSLHAKRGLGAREAPSKVVWPAAAPVGAALYVRDRRRFAPRGGRT